MVDNVLLVKWNDFIIRGAYIINIEIIKYFNLKLVN